jgi:hypothetical protein
LRQQHESCREEKPPSSLLHRYPFRILRGVDGASVPKASKLLGNQANGKSERDYIMRNFG